MSVNVISLGISAPSCKKWERKKSMESYVEFQKLKFSHTGRVETATMLIQLQKSGETAIVKTVAGCFEVPGIPQGDRAGYHVRSDFGIYAGIYPFPG